MRKGRRKMTELEVKGAEKSYFRKRAVRIYVLAASIVSAVMLSLAFAMDFDPQKQLFKIGSVLGGIAFYGTLVLTAAAIILPFVLIPKEKTDEPSLPDMQEYKCYYNLDNTFMKVLRICVASVLILQGIVRLVLTFAGIELPSFMRAQAFGLTYNVSVVAMLTVFALAFYFLPELLEKLGDTKGILHLILGSVGLVWFMFNLLEAYLNKLRPLASEYAQLTQVAYAVMLLAVTYEIKYRLDPLSIRSRIATSGAACVIGLGLGIGQLVMAVTVGQISLGATSLSVSMLALALYFGARIFFYEED